MGDFNLNITRYASIVQAGPEVDLAKVHADLLVAQQDIDAARDRHNGFLRELGLQPLP